MTQATTTFRWICLISVLLVAIWRWQSAPIESSEWVQVQIVDATPLLTGGFVDVVYLNGAQGSSRLYYTNYDATTPSFDQGSIQCLSIRDGEIVSAMLCPSR